MWYQKQYYPLLMVVLLFVFFTAITTSNLSHATGGSGGGGGGGVDEAVKITRNGEVNNKVIGMVRTLVRTARRAEEVESYLDGLQEISSIVRSGAGTYSDFGLTKDEAEDLTVRVAADLIDAKSSLREAKRSLEK